MVDVDTFLTMLYVMVDDFCTAHLPKDPSPGPQAALSRSEVLTLAIFGQWQAFGPASTKDQRLAETFFARRPCG
jgi:hypothetical protein